MPHDTQTPRSVDQSYANSFDQRLYALMAEAAAHGALENRDFRWVKVRDQILAARRTLRDIMHEDDRKGTEG